MFMTKECDYAVRIVRCLSGMDIKPVRMICESENMPLPFAYKILKKLEKAKIVKSYRGAAGGYQLQKEPGSLNLLGIVSVVDRNLLINECLQENYECKNNQPGEHCNVHIELDRIQGILENALQEKSMLELV